MVLTYFHSPSQQAHTLYYKNDLLKSLKKNPIHVLAPTQNCPYLEYTYKGTFMLSAVLLRLQIHIFYIMTNLNLLCCAQLLSRSVMSNLFATPWTAVCQVPLSMGFSRQEYWSGSHALRQGIYPNWGSDSGLLHCMWILYHLSHQGSPYDD